MTWTMHRLTVDVAFPEGLSPGAGRDGNAAEVARDGVDHPILRGSAIAGALRHEWVRRFAPNDPARSDRWFGSIGDDRDRRGVASPLQVLDARFQDGSTIRRTHNAIDRHRGSVRDGSLLSLEAMAPGAQTRLVFLLRSTAEEAADAREFLAEVAGLLRSGLAFGGGVARGIGRTQPTGPAMLRSFQLGDLEQHAAWLDEQRALHDTGQRPSGQELQPIDPPGRTLVRLKLRLPTGQDFVVGDGQGLDHTIEPQRVRSAKNEARLRLPGSSLRGVFRGWVSRLAAREGLPVADCHAKALERQAEGEELSGDVAGWGFLDDEQRAAAQEDPSSVTCPVMRLFGSLYARGRIHISDGYAPWIDGALQTRKHVSIDRISGGASDGFLFDSQVVCGAPPSAVFEIRIAGEDWDEREARWIAATIRSLDLGVLRVGSSKASGRLSLAERPEASGPHADLFRSLQPSEVAGAEA